MEKASMSVLRGDVGHQRPQFGIVTSQLFVVEIVAPHALIVGAGMAQTQGMAFFMQHRHHGVAAIGAEIADRTEAGDAGVDGD
jgi:hypothetical protein